MMRWLVGAVVLTVGIFIWVGSPLWIESSNEENYSDSDSRHSVEPMISGFNDVDASLILEVKDQERDGSYPPIVGRDDQGQFNEEPVYRGPTTILGEPADPEENLQGVDTYTGPISPWVRRRILTMTAAARPLLRCRFSWASILTHLNPPTPMKKAPSPQCSWGNRLTQMNSFISRPILSQ